MYALNKVLNLITGWNFYRYKKLNKWALEKSDEPKILQRLKENQEAIEASDYH